MREIEEYASAKVLRILVGKTTPTSFYSNFLIGNILGNKIDREDREIPTVVGENFAMNHNMYFLETSAKEAENVEKLFMKIAEDLMQVSRFCTILMRILQTFLVHAASKEQRSASLRLQQHDHKRRNVDNWRFQLL